MSALRPTRLEEALRRVDAALEAYGKRRREVGEFRRTEDPLEWIRELREARDSSAAALEHLVAEAARLGTSWGALGAALGTSKQAAHQRYGRL